MQGTTEAMSYNAIFSPLIRRSELYCCPVLLLGSISSGPRSLMHYTFGLKPKHGSAAPSSPLQLAACGCDAVIRPLSHLLTLFRDCTQVVVLLSHSISTRLAMITMHVDML